MTEQDGKVASFYRTYLEFFSPGSKVAEGRASALLPHLEPHLPGPGTRVLDLCCGAGVFSFELERMGLEVTGVDLLEPMIAEATRHGGKVGSKVDFVVGDATDLTFDDGRFDAVVFLGNSLPGFSANLFAKVAREAKRVLKSGGLFAAHYYDAVHDMCEGYKPVTYEKTERGELVSVHGGYDGERGTFERVYHNFSTGETFHYEEYIWTPWMFRHLMGQAGFEERSVTRIAPDCYLDWFSA